MFFIEVFNYSLVFVAGGLVSYYFLISLLALRENKNAVHETATIRKFAVILLAKDKDQNLSRSLYSLSGLVYPKNKYDLIVIADSYSDRIVQLAEKVGAKIKIPPADRRGEDNNALLPWIFNDVLQGGEPYDAVVIFDSDGLVSGNFLEVMNYYLEQGSEAVQCSYKNLYSPENWIDKIREVDFTIDRFVYPSGRKVLGLGISHQSNGVCFSTPLLYEFPWKIEKHPSIIEYGFDLRLNGIDIDFASSAVVYTTILPENRDRNSNFSNLDTNNYQLIRRYTPQLLSTIVETKSLKYVDMFFELVFPRPSNFMLFIVAMGVINSVFWGLTWVSLPALMSWLIINGVAIASITVALMAAGAQQKILKSVIYIPITIYIKALDFIQKYRREKKPIIGPDEKENSFAVSDEKHPV